MSEDTAGFGPDSMVAGLQSRNVSENVVSDTRAALAAATREVIDELVRTTAADDDLERAAELVSEAAALLRQRTHGRTYFGVAEGALSDGHNFIDFSPFFGLMNPLAPPMAVEFDDDNNVIATCTYGSAYEGPPGCLHGGFIAAGFDEVLGVAQAYSGAPGMTARLTISYRSPTPLHRPVRFVARFDRVDGRKVYASATLSDGDTLCAEAEGLFISMKPQVFERFLKMRAGDGGTDASTAPD